MPQIPEVTTSCGFSSAGNAERGVRAALRVPRQRIKAANGNQQGAGNRVHAICDELNWHERTVVASMARPAQLRSRTIWKARRPPVRLPDVGLRTGGLKPELHLRQELRPPIAGALQDSPARQPAGQRECRLTRRANPGRLLPGSNQNSVKGIVTGVPTAALRASDDTPMFVLTIAGLILRDLQVFKKPSETRPDAAPPNCSAWRQ